MNLFYYEATETKFMDACRSVIDITTSHSTKPARGQVAGYPAKAGIQRLFNVPLGFVPAMQGNYFIDWIPAYAGMMDL